MHNPKILFIAPILIFMVSFGAYTEETSRSKQGECFMDECSYTPSWCCEGKGLTNSVGQTESKMVCDSCYSIKGLMKLQGTNYVKPVTGTSMNKDCGSTFECYYDTRSINTTLSIKEENGSIDFFMFMMTVISIGLAIIAFTLQPDGFWRPSQGVNLESKV